MNAAASTLSRVFPVRPVFERTRAGQHEVLLDGLRLGPVERRLLLLVNGFTPLIELARRLPDRSRAIRQARELADIGLIREVEMDRLAYYFDALHGPG